LLGGDPKAGHDIAAAEKFHATLIIGCGCQ